MSEQLLTIGHSNHALDQFIALLRRHGVTALADVRSQPYSRRFPHFSREPLRETLRDGGVEYVFLGKELGARSQNPACYRGGKVHYASLAMEPTFETGLERLVRGMANHQIVLMCAERDPLECHRAVLVARALHDRGVPVSHILGDGALEPHGEMEGRLLRLLKIPEGDLFKSRAECIQEAYEIQGERIAYSNPNFAET
ncbi:DUF488 domain-containing protein [Methylotetracoccus oryzae]|uniref:DUF488 domain-containing protein n=1 Tax=Methylotetracoccus oryzae TaxID=1919059 RepID=UPI001118C21D|nr:DUF488 domain-containing protein [Methylotetracoccus oryzae]